MLTLHLSALDHIEHDTGSFSPESIVVLESIDATIGKIRQTAERLAPGRAYVAVVSDHAFVRTDSQPNLFPAFREANLITANDAATISQVRDLLAKLASDPANGIDRILESEELHKRGGYPTASFCMNLKPGWRTGATLDGPVLSKTPKVGGTHGGLPDIADLRAAFFLVGPGVPAARWLGVIDMRDVAPTLAHVAGLSLPTADGKILLPN